MNIYTAAENGIVFVVLLMIITARITSGQSEIDSCKDFELISCGGLDQSWAVCYPRASNIIRILSVRLDVRYETRNCRRYGTPMNFGLSINGRGLWTVNGCFGSFLLCLEKGTSEADNNTKIDSNHKAEDPVISDGNEYRVIEGETGKLSCNIKGGNKSATIVWECNNLSPDETVWSNNGSVTKTLTWTAVRGSNISCACISQQAGFSKTINSVNVTVLYPPSPPDYNVNETFINSDVRFIVGDTKSIQCVTDSNPASSYSWTGPATGSKQTLTITNVRKTHAGQYTCTASNTMNPSNQSSQNGYNSSSVNLVVLYPPEVQKIENMTLVEGSKLDYNCSFTAGVPTQTSVRWIRDFDTSTWNDTHLVIQSVSREDAGKYMCEASNTMYATGETLSHIGKSQEMFYLEVQCTPRARDAVVTEITAEIGHTVTFVFNALAYPYPTFTWWKLVKAKWKQLSNGENILIQSSDLLSNFTIRKVSQTDFTYYKVFIKNDLGINEQTYELLQSEIQNTDRKDQNGDFKDIAPVIGYTIGATVGCFILIIMTVFLVRRFCSKKAKTNKSREPAIDMTKVEETAVETAFHNIMNYAQVTHDSSELSSQGGLYYNQERPNYETLDMENQDVSHYSSLETTTSGQTNVEETYVKMD